MNDLGKKLNFFRRLRRMSLRDLAAKAKCSPGYISLVELGRASPTVKRLNDLCNALDITISDFLREEPSLPAPIILFKGQRPSQPHVLSWGKTTLVRLLPEELERPFTALLLRLEPGGSVPTRQALHPILQMCTVLSGHAICKVRGVDYEMAAGDSLCFDLSCPHQWRNVTELPAEVQLVGPGAFTLFEQVEENVRWHVQTKRQRRRAKRQAKIEAGS